MEVEAKFAVDDEEVFRRLAQEDMLAGYRLMPGVEREVRDAYLDSADGKIAAAGYTLRRRDWGDVVTVTLKQAAAGAGEGDEDGAAGRRRSAALRRDELEVTMAVDDLTAAGDGGQAAVTLLTGGLAVKGLPPGPLRRRLSAMLGSAALEMAAALTQRRIARDAFDDDRLVAEVSFDEVRVQSTAGAQPYFEIEAELRPQGTDDDLEKLSTALREERGLRPETRSKYARARASIAAAEVAGAVSGDTPEAATSAETEAPSAGSSAQPGAASGAAVEATASSPGAGEPGADNGGFVLVPPPSKDAEEKKVKKKRKAPGIVADDLMSEAARKTLTFHFERMLAHEDGTRAGEDIEELHDMRVATRRMRAALAVFEPYIDGKAYKPYLKDLRRTGRLLGRVRDLDVFHEKAQHYLDDLPEGRRDELHPLFEAWKVEREERRAKMLGWLDGPGYREFVESFGEFLDKPGAGARPDFDTDGSPLGRRVLIVLPPIVLGELATVLAYDEWVTGPGVPLTRLHQLRIAGKYLRYTLEFFSEVLGSGSKLVIHNVKSLQDHLGDLQDAVVTSSILRDFLAGRGWGREASKQAKAQGSDLIIAPGVANYMAFKQVELARLVETFPEAWEPIRAPRYRHTMLSLLSKL